MMGKKTVGEIVRGRPAYVVQQSDSVLEASRYMTEYGVDAVLVLDEGDVVGIISERDVMARVVARKKDPAHTPVRDVMSSGDTVLSEDCTCREAVAIMQRLSVHHLPVLGGNRLAGCVSICELWEAEAGAQATDTPVREPTAL